MGETSKVPGNIYEFKVSTIDGKEICLDQYRGKVMLIVNVACFWGSTDKTYKQLKILYDKYESKGLRILAFPCNQFGHQEPGTPEEIKKFVSKYPVKFDMFSKIDVNGGNCIPLYKYLKSCGGKEEDISWNFAKFLINRQGKVIKRYGPKEEPFSFEDDIVKLLEE